MTTTLEQTQHDTADDNIYSEETGMTSIVSYPARCRLWGEVSFPWELRRSALQEPGPPIRGHSCRRPDDGIGYNQGCH